MAIKASDRGQTFTLEGIAASLLLILATYTVFQSSVVVSPSWSEFTNVQLKQTAYDLLRAADNRSSNTSWQFLLKNLNTSYCDPYGCNISLANPALSQNLSLILNSIGADARLEAVWLVDNNTINTTVLKPFDDDPTPNAVRASRLIFLDTVDPDSIFNHSDYKDYMVVEVRLTLWRI